MKLLFISNITGKKVGSFSIASIYAAKRLGIEYHMAANFRNSSSEQMKKDEEEYGIKLHQIDFERNPSSLANRYAYKQLVELIQREQFDAIHCNTPIGGLAGRLAGKKCKVKKILYQAHGFHFYKGAPIKNWLLYYPVERWLAHYTDVIITINQEDYDRVKSFNLRGKGSIYYVPGVGIDLSLYKTSTYESTNKRTEIGIKDNQIVVISAGDLIERKNYDIAIKAIAKTNRKDIHYIICGQGPLREHLELAAKECGIEDQVHFLGYRTDVLELMSVSDVFLFTTKQEGLPRSLSEAMAIGLPCVVSRIRGNTDMIEDGVNGFLYEPEDIDGFAKGILTLAENSNLRIMMCKNNKERIKAFSLDTVVKDILDIYKAELV